MAAKDEKIAELNAQIENTVQQAEEKVKCVQQQYLDTMKEI